MIVGCVVLLHQLHTDTAMMLEFMNVDVASKHNSTQIQDRAVLFVSVRAAREDILHQIHACWDRACVLG